MDPSQTQEMNPEDAAAHLAAIKVQEDLAVERARLQRQSARRTPQLRPVHQGKPVEVGDEFRGTKPGKREIYSARVQQVQKLPDGTIVGYVLGKPERWVDKARGCILHQGPNRKQKRAAAAQHRRGQLT